MLRHISYGWLLSLITLLPSTTLQAQNQSLSAKFQLLAAAEEKADQPDSAEKLDEQKEAIDQKNQAIQNTWEETLANPLEMRASEKLKQMIGEEADRQGLLTGIMSGLMLLYSTLSDLLLHPILIIVLILLTIGLIILIILIVLRVRKEKFSTLGRLMSFGIIYLLLYIDLLLMIYEGRKVSGTFFRWDKDIILMVLASLVGYLAGRYASQKSFEEKVLP